MPAGRRPSHVERLSLRIAILTTAALYAALFVLVEPWPPSQRPAPEGSGEAAASGRAPTVVTVVLEGGGLAPSVDPRAASGSASPDRRPQPAGGIAAESTAVATGAPQAPGGGEAAARSPQHPTRIARPAPAAAEAAAAGAAARAPATDGAAATAARAPATDGAARAGGGESASARGAVGTASQASDVAAMLALIRERIERERIYPIAARLRGIEGSVTAAVTVNGTGSLASERLVHSSGSEILDRAGIALLRRIFPLPDATGSSFTLQVRIDYRLVGADESD